MSEHNHPRAIEAIWDDSHPIASAMAEQEMASWRGSCSVRTNTLAHAVHNTDSKS